MQKGLQNVSCRENIKYLLSSRHENYENLYIHDLCDNVVFMQQQQVEPSGFG
jgi:HD superfamily phosphohydrolase